MTSGLTSWPEPPGALPLTRDDVHVWGVRLEDSPARAGHLRPILSGDERERADRFVFDADRHRFIAAHAAVRTILARYLERPAQELRFTSGSHGKPALRDGGGIRFNLSHSGDAALVAVGRGRDLGVDIEHARGDRANADVARRFFSPREVAALEALPYEQRARGFFDCWARKEAYVKARGEGLSVPLDRFSVSLAPGEPAAFVAFEESPEEWERWTLRELPTGPDYAAALVAEGHDWALGLWGFTP